MANQEKALRYLLAGGLLFVVFLLIVQMRACPPHQRPSVVDASGPTVVTDAGVLPISDLGWPLDNPDDPPGGEARRSVMAVENLTNDDTVLFVAFGSDSVVLPAAWPFCVGGGLNCSFPLGKRMVKNLPLSGNYLNATFSFGAAVACGITKAEVNVNNPGWYDTLDVSLVDGFSNKISISATSYGRKPVVLGPPNGKDGNEKVFGLFPYGCDICVARQSPPCSIPHGSAGCKGGTQYKPDVVCQYQGPQKTGGQKIVVRLEK